MCRGTWISANCSTGGEKPDADPTVIPQCIIDSLCCATTAVHRDSPSWPDLQGGTNRAEKICTQSCQTEPKVPTARKRRMLIFALQWTSPQGFALQEKLWERVNLSGFKSQASMELLRVLSKQTVLGHFMGAHQPRGSFWRKISAETALC